MKLPWLQVWQSIEVTANAIPAEVVKRGTPQLRELGLNEATNKPEGYELFKAQILSICKFFIPNDEAMWDADMIREAAQLAYDENHWMTVVEVKYFFARIKYGKYTSHKNFTPAVFMQYLNSYTNEILSTRGAVNSYHWRNNPIPDNMLFPTHDEEGKPIKYVTRETVEKTVAKMTKDFALLAEQEEAERIRNREARVKALKRERDQKIIDLVEHEVKNGREVDKHLLEAYHKALKNMKE